MRAKSSLEPAGAQRADPHACLYGACHGYITAHTSAAARRAAGAHALRVCAGAGRPGPRRPAATAAAAGRADGRAARGAAERRVCQQPLPPAPLQPGAVALPGLPAARSARSAVQRRWASPSLARMPSAELLSDVGLSSFTLQAGSGSMHGCLVWVAPWDATRSPVCAALAVRRRTGRLARRRSWFSVATWSTACAACACGRPQARPLRQRSAQPGTSPSGGHIPCACRHAVTRHDPS
jgi:hypothetical protein